MTEKIDAFVMDCSVTMALLLVEEQQGIKKIESLFNTAEAVVPTLWQYEVANVLCMAERSKRIHEADIAEIKAVLEALPIQIDETPTKKVFGNTLHLAREHQLTVYEASYLELAMRKGIPLATFDKQLKAVAKAVGSKVVA